MRNVQNVLYGHWTTPAGYYHCTATEGLSYRPSYFFLSSLFSLNKIGSASVQIVINGRGCPLAKFCMFPILQKTMLSFPCFQLVKVYCTAFTVSETGKFGVSCCCVKLGADHAIFFFILQMELLVLFLLMVFLWRLWGLLIRAVQVAICLQSAIFRINK